jgi:putative membrane protein
MPDQPSNRSYWVLLFLKGIVMGAADVVPGVSGGTIAFITGIYERLLNALKKLHPYTLKILWQDGFQAFWKAIDGQFLLILFSGILVSILSLAKLIHYAIDTFPIIVWSFFFGLVLASCIYLIRQIPRWRWQEFVAIAIGTAVAVTISLLRPAQLPDTGWMMMISGFIAICAMILPGISGSFILLLMGMYSVFIKALSELDVVLLASFGVGCIAGLIVFSHILSFLLQRYLSLMLAILTGFLIGSLNVLWPWKQVLEATINRHGELIPLVQRNLSPLDYPILVGEPGQLWLAILAASVGFLIVFVLDRLSYKQS